MNGGIVLRCAKVSDHGSYDTQTIPTELALKQCETEDKKCRGNPGKGGSEIKWHTLSTFGIIEVGELGGGDLGVDLTSLSVPFQPAAEYECGTGNERFQVRLSGSVIGTMTPANAMTTTFKETFTAQGNQGEEVQEPTRFVGNSMEHLLEEEYRIRNSVPFTLVAGLTLKDKITNASALEIRTFAEVEKIKPLEGVLKWCFRPFSGGPGFASWWWGEAVEHQSDHRPVDHRFVGLG